MIQASVNLATEAAVVRISLVSGAPSASTKKEVGEALAKHLSSCGYKSSVRGWYALIAEKYEVIDC